MNAKVRLAVGLFIAGMSMTALLVSFGLLHDAVQNAEGPLSTTRTPRERSYSVNVGTLTPETITPTITTFGRIASGRSLELRAAVAGALVELSDNFRDGGAVREGEVLFRINPAKLETAVLLAESDVREAEADLAQARAALELAILEAEAAQTQLELREQAVTRQQDLRERGVATEAEVETAVLARASAQQTLINRRQVVAGDEARVAQAEIALDRRGIALAEARRTLDEATVIAPFDGVMTGVDAVLGGLVSTNERLGTLIDPLALEVAFRVTNTQFSRLLNDQGALRKTDVTLLARTGRSQTEVTARIDRAGAEVGEGQVGRIVYARLSAPDANVVRPGDFVTVQIPERPLADVARIPASAATVDGRILLIGEGNRLEEGQARLLRQQGDDLIVADVPFGRQYVLARAVQLGAGIRVETKELTSGGAPQPAAAAAPETAETIALDPERRAAIIAFIEASETMKPEMREKFLNELAQPEVPLETVEKFEAKMAGE